MISNFELSYAVENLHEFSTAKEETESHIRFLMNRLKSLETLESAALAVTEVVDGVCITAEMDESDRWRRAFTPILPGDIRRRAEISRNICQGYGWSVTLGEESVKNAGACGRSGEIFSWAEDYEEARSVAKEWLSKGELPVRSHVCEQMECSMIAA